jgi:CheY-like chemotaxis protein
VEILNKNKYATNIEKEKDEVIKFTNSRILVVDDIIINRELIKGMLKNSDIEILEAENGYEALLYARKYKPDLILMDIRMPVMDGYDATNQLRDDKELRQIPVVALTASLSAERNFNEKARFDGFLKKPITIRHIYHELKKYLPYKKILKTKPVSEQGKSILNQHNFSEVPILEIKEVFKEKINPLWEKAIITDNMDEIIEFAKILEITGKKFNLQDLVNYSGEILKLTQSYDIEGLVPLLDSFCNIKKSVEEISVPK